MGYFLDHSTRFQNFREIFMEIINNPFGDCNGTQTHNHLVRKRTLNHIECGFTLKRVSDMIITYNPFGLYVIYLEIFFRVYFNELEQITDITLFNYFIERKTRAEYVKKIKRQIIFSLINFYCLHRKKVLRCLNSTLDGVSLEQMFLT